MEDLDRYRQIIEDALTEYTLIPYSHGELQCEAVFDRQRDRYLLITVGWDRDRRVHYTLVHGDIINVKFWIQRDGTEEGIATDLLRAGVPKEHIVLAFRPEYIRPYTEFAVA